MRHRKYEELLVLSVNGVLTPAEESDLVQHLAGCSQCRNERVLLQKLGKSVEAAREVPRADEALLQESRRDLHALLLREVHAHQRISLFARFRELAPPIRISFAGALVFVLAVGLLAGWFLRPGREPARSPQGLATAATASFPQEGKTEIANVRFFDRGESSGTVEFSFDAITPVRMRGSVDDPAIQKVLVRAVLHDENPGVRLTAMNAISAGQPFPEDKEIETALVKALKSDPNAGVRKQALAMLHKMPLTEEIKQAFLNTLVSDTNPGLRVAAINALDEAWGQSATIDPKIREVLQEKVQSDKNDYVRLKAKAVLLEKP